MFTESDFCKNRQQPTIAALWKATFQAGKTTFQEGWAAVISCQRQALGVAPLAQNHTRLMSCYKAIAPMGLPECAEARLVKQARKAPDETNTIFHAARAEAQRKKTVWPL
jgi:hypothetical protein